MDTMKKILHQSLQKLSEQHTKQTLGDRRNYLGASDVGACPRKVILDRINQPEHDLATLLRFQRGHKAEDILAEAYTAGGYSNFERQVEIDISTDNVPCLVHIDFVFTSAAKKEKTIVEVKSGKIPETVYSSWESQLYLQMGALAKKYPAYTIKGAILSLDLSEGDAEIFNSYTPNDRLFTALVQRCEHIWHDYQQTLNGQEVELQTNVSPLCGFCSHIQTCPRFQADDLDYPEMIHYVQEFEGYRQAEKESKKRVANHKNALLGMVNARGSFRSGGYLFKKVTRTRQTLDKDRLSRFLADNGVAMSEFERSSTFSFLDIKKAPKEKQPQ
ncbi:hypothetical protein [Desulfogranum marinum]|uniref:hypothetical protein n=1 Tax=Desulfogranum marinum TaxID=453220 RepID=UPI001963FF94|nr:hypothetical protein [Desulfogranum marinum]MBM9514256.1 hypothetical protein [Desulfogranum marinum]